MKTTKEFTAKILVMAEPESGQKAAGGEWLRRAIQVEDVDTGEVITFTAWKGKMDDYRVGDVVRLSIFINIDLNKVLVEKK